MKKDDLDIYGEEELRHHNSEVGAIVAHAHILS